MKKRQHLLMAGALLLGTMTAVSCSRLADGSVPADDAAARSNSADFAQCMRDAGFEFVEELAGDGDQPSEGVVVLGAFLDETDRSTVDDIGYGEVARLRQQGADGDLLSDGIAVAPNLAVYLALDEPTQRAYDEEFVRCQSQFPLRPVLEEEEVAAERRAAADRYERLISDPDFVDALDGWQRCMSGRGFAFDNPEEVRFSIENRFSDVVRYDEDWTPTADPGPFPMSPPAEFDESALAELERDEMILAKADLECQVEHDLKAIVGRFVDGE